MIRRSVAIAATGAIVLTTTVACSSTSESGSDAHGATSYSGVSEADQQEIEENVEQGTAEPTWEAPGPEFDASKAAGKTVFSIPLSSNISFEVATEEAQAKIAEAIGINYISYKNQGSPDEWIAGMNQAIAQKVDLIMLSNGTNPALLQPQIQRAQEAGIPVIATNSPDPETFPEGTIPDEMIANLSAYSPGPHSKASALMADWVIKDSGGQANALIISSNDAPPSTGQTHLIVEEFETRCPECKTQTINVNSSTWATKIPTEVRTALTKDPSIDYVMPLYGQMGLLALPAIAAVGRSAQVKVATWDGDAAYLKAIADGTPAKMIVGESSSSAAYHWMDLAMRFLVGLTPETRAIPVQGIRIFTEENVGDAGDPPQFGTGYGDADAAGFTKLWGLTEPPL